MLRAAPAVTPVSEAREAKSGAFRQINFCGRGARGLPVCPNDFCSLRRPLASFTAYMEQGGEWSDYKLSANKNVVATNPWLLTPFTFHRHRVAT